MIDLFGDFPDLAHQCLENLKKYGAIVEKDIGGYKYSQVGSSVIRVGEPLDNGEFLSPVMDHDDRGIPSVARSKELEKVCDKFVEGLQTFVDTTSVVGALFGDYDRSRLIVPPAYGDQIYTNTVVEEATQRKKVRDPPHWLLEKQLKEGNELIIATDTPDRYKLRLEQKTGPSPDDLSLKTNCDEMANAVFPSPAYYKEHADIHVDQVERDDVLEMRYFFKGSFQQKFLSRSQDARYAVSRHGSTTIIANRSNTIVGTSDKRSTDFYYFTNMDAHARSLQFFQHKDTRLLGYDSVSRKSSFADVVTEEHSKGLYILTEIPISGRVVIRGGQVFFHGVSLRPGNNFVTRLVPVNIKGRPVDPDVIVLWFERKRRKRRARVVQYREEGPVEVEVEVTTYGDEAIYKQVRESDLLRDGGIEIMPNDAGVVFNSTYGHSRCSALTLERHSRVTEASDELIVVCDTIQIAGIVKQTYTSGVSDLVSELDAWEKVDLTDFVTSQDVEQILDDDM